MDGFVVIVLLTVKIEVINSPFTINHWTDMQLLLQLSYG